MKKEDDIQLFDPGFHVHDPQSMTLRLGAVVPLAEHQILAGGIIKLCYPILTANDRAFLSGIKLQRKPLSPKQQVWFDDIRHRVGQFFADALAEERRQLAEKYGLSKKDPATRRGM
jgi:hypothetical protein